MFCGTHGPALAHTVGGGGEDACSRERTESVVEFRLCGVGTPQDRIEGASRETGMGRA